MIGADDNALIQIRNGASDLEHSVVGAGGHAELFKGAAQHIFRFFIDQAEFAQFGGVDARIARCFAVFEAFALNFTRRVDAFFDLRRAFGDLVAAQLVELTGGTSMWISKRSSSGPEILFR